MAGAKKKNIVDVPQSKTARASMAKGKKPEGFIASGELDRFISLAGGEYVYLLDPRTGATHHLRVGSDSYETVLNGLLDSAHGERIRIEAVKKGFPLPIAVEAV
jgi:hypothetical protein